MITVAIVGILAAIAIPRYQLYMLRTRRVEASTILNIAKVAQITHFTALDCFATVELTPRTFTEFLPSGQPWDSQALNGGTCPGEGSPKSMEDLGARPSVRIVFFRYACTSRYATTTDTAEFTCNARGDLDADAVPFEMIYGTDNDRDGLTIAAPVTGRQSPFPYELGVSTPGVF